MFLGSDVSNFSSNETRYSVCFQLVKSSLISEKNKLDGKKQVRLTGYSISFLGGIIGLGGTEKHSSKTKNYKFADRAQ